MCMFDWTFPDRNVPTVHPAKSDSDVMFRFVYNIIRDLWLIDYLRINPQDRINTQVMYWIVLDQV